MEIDQMWQQGQDEGEEGDSELNTDSEEGEEGVGSLFFMASDHESIRKQEAAAAHEYWESGITVESLNLLKTGNFDHKDKVCYHCEKRGHIKANCPERRRSGQQPWTQRREGASYQQKRIPFRRFNSNNTFTKNSRFTPRYKTQSSDSKGWKGTREKTGQFRKKSLHQLAGEENEEEKQDF